MSETNFFGLSRRSYDPLAKSRPLVVPERSSVRHPVSHSVAHHRTSVGASPASIRAHRTTNIAPAKPKHIVTPPSKKSAPRPITTIKPATSSPTLAAVRKSRTPAISVDELLKKTTAKEIVKTKPLKVAKPVGAKKTRTKLIHKLATRKRGKVEKATAKKIVKTPKIQPKIVKKEVVKTSQTHHTKALASAKKVTSTKPVKHPDFTTQALTSAVNSANTGVQQPTHMMMSGNGEAIAESENILDKFPKIAFEVKINKKRIFAVIRTVIILTILTISGYLAWDTWAVNQVGRQSLSNPAMAVAIDEAGPSGVDMTSISNQAWAAHTMPADQARYVYLPTINAQARVMSVGINSKGKVDAPKNVNDVSWYDGSAKPGQEGQVFLNGHSSFASTYRAAFDNLSKLEIGARIAIERGDGKIIYYSVVENETIDADKLDMKMVLSVPEDATKGLTLMSCTGKFDYRTQSSDKRVIVRAVQVQE